MKNRQPVQATETLPGCGPLFKHQRPRHRSVETRCVEVAVATHVVDGERRERLCQEHAEEVMSFIRHNGTPLSGLEVEWDCDAAAQG